MQYKIPIQIENEDPIIWILSMRQLGIIFSGLWIWYASYSSLEKVTSSTELALIPLIFFTAIAFTIALFKYSEMTFMVFLFALLRNWVNDQERYWQKWVDSFSGLEIWFITDINNKTERVDFWNKIDKIKSIEDQLEKI